MGSDRVDTAAAQRGTTDAELVARAHDGRQDAIEAIFERYGEDLHRFCFALKPDDGATALFTATVVRAVGELHAGGASGELEPWLFGLAQEEAGEEEGEDEAEPPPASPQEDAEDKSFSRFLSLARTERAVLVMRELTSFGCDAIGGVIGLTGDSVQEILEGAREKVTTMFSRSGPDCGLIRSALAQDALSPLEQDAVDKHLTGCDHCRRAAAAASGIGPALKRALPKLTTTGLAFALREGLAHAAVGPSGPGGALGASAAAEAERRYLRRRSIAAGGVLGLLVVVAVLAVSTGRLDPDQRVSSAFPPLASTLLSLHDLGIQPDRPGEDRPGEDRPEEDRPPDYPPADTTDCAEERAGCPAPECPTGFIGLPPDCLPVAPPPPHVPPPPPPPPIPRCPFGTGKPPCAQGPGPAIHPQGPVDRCDSGMVAGPEGCVPELEPLPDLCDRGDGQVRHEGDDEHRGREQRGHRHGGPEPERHPVRSALPTPRPSRPARGWHASRGPRNTHAAPVRPQPPHPRAPLREPEPVEDRPPTPPRPPRPTQPTPPRPAPPRSPPPTPRPPAAPPAPTPGTPSPARSHGRGEHCPPQGHGQGRGQSAGHQATHPPRP
jgi:DNA-directed RNA polymerase specialized sigma24 family protein